MPKVRCPRCGTTVDYADGFQPVCPACGYTSAAPAAPTTWTAAPAPTTVYVAQPPRAGPSQGTAVVALLLNVLIWPGLGTLVGGRVGEGLAQGLLTLFGVILIITIIGMIVGIPLVIAMWIWALVTGINLVNQANRNPV